MTERPSRALLVESEPEWRKVLQPFLERSGFAVSTCASARQALRELEGCPGFSFAFIELDLPDLPGWQLWNRLCTDPASPMAVFWGPSLELWERLGLRQHPRVCFLRKPFRREELSHAIDELSRRRMGF